MSEGHIHARRYPVGMVFVEAEFVVARHNQNNASYAVLTQMAVSSILSKEANTEFKKQIRKLTQT